MNRRETAPALLIDAGNSRIKWRMTGDKANEGACSVEAIHECAPTSWRSMPAPGRVLVSLVSGARLRDAVTRRCVETWGVEPRFAESTSPVPGITNRYDNPAQLGVDRWLALIAAWHLRPGVAVVVDCGTAITMDLVDAKGVFRGGMIIPGRRVLESAFSERVPHLDAAAERMAGFPASNTADAIALGIQTAVVASLDRFIDNSRALTGHEPSVRITGGDGSWLSELWSGEMTLYDNLVLDGLQTLLELEA